MNMMKMMQQAQKMQQQMQKSQEELSKREFSSEVAGGRVKAVANGAGDLISISISPEVINPEEPELLEDLVLSAVKQAVDKGRQTAAAEMQKLTAGLGLPPGLGF